MLDRGLWPSAFWVECACACMHACVRVYDICMYVHICTGGVTCMHMWGIQLTTSHIFLICLLPYFCVFFKGRYWCLWFLMIFFPFLNACWDSVFYMYIFIITWFFWSKVRVYCENIFNIAKTLGKRKRQLRKMAVFSHKRCDLPGSDQWYRFLRHIF